MLATREATAGWQTERIQRPVLILGQLDGILTGVRQLRRTRPLETEEVAGLRVRTLPDMARIKAWLRVTRYTVRDYLDAVVAAASPLDAARIELGRYRAIRSPWDDWDHVVARGRAWAPVVARLVLEAPP